MSATELMPLAIFFVLTFGVCATLYFALEKGDRPLRQRLDDMAVKFRLGAEGDANAELAPHGMAAKLMEFAQRRLPDPNIEKPAVEKLVQTLQYAGFYGPSAAKLFQLLRLLITVVLAVIGYTVGNVYDSSPLFLMVVFGAGGYALPIFYVRSMANRRQVRIRREIPDLIDLLVVCVECGLGLMAAIRIVGRESERHGRIMGEQLLQLSAQITAASTLGEGLRGVADRTGVDDIKTFSAILVQSEKLGSEMSDALRATAEQLRNKRSLRAEEMAQKLPVKMIFPMVLFLLPAMMLVLVGPAMINIFRFFNSGH
jgi:tight adherence protein C